MAAPSATTSAPGTQRGRPPVLGSEDVSCVFADAACTVQDPALRLLGEGHRVACIRAPIEALVA